MISEGSCDTEDWSNDAENSAFTSQEYISILINCKKKKKKVEVVVMFLNLLQFLPLPKFLTAAYMVWNAYIFNI